MRCLHQRAKRESYCIARRFQLKRPTRTKQRKQQLVYRCVFSLSSEWQHGTLPFRRPGERRELWWARHRSRPRVVGLAQCGAPFTAHLMGR